MSKRSGRRWFSTPLDPGWATVIAALIGTIGLLAVALLSRVSLVPTPPSTATITLAENPIATFTFAPTFAPLPSETPVPTIVPSQTAYPISSGHLDIPEGGQADLDTGQVSHIGADILFEVVSANDRFIDPLIGSRGAIYGASVDPPGIEGCMSRNLTSDRFRIDNNNFLPGTYVCVVTDEDHYSQVQVTDPLGLSPAVLSIDYITWSQPAR